MIPETTKLRARFQRDGINCENLASDPMVVLREWRDLAGPGQSPFAFTTVNSNGRPTSRMMDAVSIDHGLIILTNETSRKGREIAETGDVAVTFNWHTLGRQVNLVGTCSMLQGQHDTFFAMMPKSLQAVAATTQQSATLDSRAEMEAVFESTKAVYQNAAIPRPDTWKAYRVVPTEIEFWQRRSNELQDRIRYLRTPHDPDWQKERLSP